MTKYGTFALALAATALLTTAAVAQRSTPGVAVVNKLYTVGSTTSTTTISGKGGAPVSHTLRSQVKDVTENDAALLKQIFFYEKSDDPIRITMSGSLPVLVNGEEKHHGASFAFGSDDFNNGTMQVLQIGAGRAVTSIQVCLNNDKIKGARVWGADFDAQGNPRRDHAIYSEFKRPNCGNNGWQQRRTCPGNQVAVGLRLENGAKGFSGMSLVCADFKRVQQTAGTPSVPTPR